MNRSLHILHTFNAMYVKVNLPCVRHEDIGRTKVERHAFLSSALNKDDWQASRSSRLISGERTLGTYRMGAG
jgi:hypothetical protein